MLPVSNVCVKYLMRDTSNSKKKLPDSQWNWTWKPQNEKSIEFFNDRKNILKILLWTKRLMIPFLNVTCEWIFEIYFTKQKIKLFWPWRGKNLICFPIWTCHATMWFFCNCHSWNIHWFSVSHPLIRYGYGDYLNIWIGAGAQLRFCIKHGDKIVVIQYSCNGQNNIKAIL